MPHWWNSPDLATIPWTPGPRSPAAYALVEFYRSSWEIAANIPEFLAALPPGGKEAGLNLYECYKWLADTAPGDNLTITHFNFRSDNLFFDEANREDPVVVFDWQQTSLSWGVLDVAYLMAGSITVELRGRVEREILTLYYNRLLGRAVKGYSFEQCHRDYLYGLVVYSYIPVLMYSRVDMSSERGTELVRLVTKRHFSAILDNHALSYLPKGD